MSGLFATARKEVIKVGDDDDKVIGVLREEAAWHLTILTASLKAYRPVRCSAAEY
jgi:hypothetical protein